MFAKKKALAGARAFLEVPWNDSLFLVRLAEHGQTRALVFHHFVAGGNAVQRIDRFFFTGEVVNLLFSAATKRDHFAVQEVGLTLAVFVTVSHG